eukprot:6034686-Karenia_brevis.AAC.1
MSSSTRAPPKAPPGYRLRTPPAANVKLISSRSVRKDSVLWQLQSRMVAIVQQIPSRKVAQGGHL